jgi:hypothetical protein
MHSEASIKFEFTQAAGLAESSDGLGDAEDAGLLSWILLTHYKKLCILFDVPLGTWEWFAYSSFHCLVCTQTRCRQQTTASWGQLLRKMAAKHFSRSSEWCEIQQDKLPTYNTVARSRNDCCYGYATMRYLSIVDIYVAVNNIKPSSFAMETQEWVPFPLRWAAKYFVPLSTIEKYFALYVKR